MVYIQRLSIAGRPLTLLTRTNHPHAGTARSLAKSLGRRRGFFVRARRLSWVDVLVVLGLVGLLFALVDLAGQWTGKHRASVAIDLSPWALPRYTLYSLARGLIAYGISLVFTLVYGYWAAKDPGRRPRA